MFQKLLSLSLLAAAVTLTLGSSDAQARSWRSQYWNNGCCQNSNYAYQNHYHSNRSNSCCYQQTNYVANACWTPQPTCGVQVQGFSAAGPMSNATAQPATLQSPAPAPAPGF